MISNGVAFILYMFSSGVSFNLFTGAFFSP